MKWLLAGLAFAAVVGLAVATAAIRAENIAKRRVLQRLVEQRLSLQVEAEAARAYRISLTDPRQLVQRWAEFRADFEERSW